MKSEDRLNDSPRRKAREISLQILFQREFTPEMSVDTSLKYFRGYISAADEAWEYAEVLLNGVDARCDEIDRFIRDSSHNWKIERISPVDLCILRQSVFEMISDNVPFKVAIDEAVELAKKYGSTESAHFINGILDDVHKRAL